MAEVPPAREKESSIIGSGSREHDRARARLTQRLAL